MRSGFCSISHFFEFQLYNCFISYSLIYFQQLVTFAYYSFVAFGVEPLEGNIWLVEAQSQNLHCSQTFTGS